MHSNWVRSGSKYNSKGVIDIEIQQWYKEEATRLMLGLGKPLPNNLHEQIVTTPLYYLSSASYLFAKLTTKEELFAVTEAIILLTESTIVTDLLLGNKVISTEDIQPLLPKGILPIFAHFFKHECKASPRYDLDLSTMMDIVEDGAPTNLANLIETYTILYSTLSNVETSALTELNRFVIKRTQFVCNKIMDMIYMLKFTLERKVNYEA